MGSEMCIRDRPARMLRERVKRLKGREVTGNIIITIVVVGARGKGNAKCCESAGIRSPRRGGVVDRLTGHFRDIIIAIMSNSKRTPNHHKISKPHKITQKPQDHPKSQHYPDKFKTTSQKITQNQQNHTKKTENKPKYPV